MAKLIYPDGIPRRRSREAIASMGERTQTPPMSKKIAVMGGSVDMVGFVGCD